jgi:hypothetical protein
MTSPFWFSTIIIEIMVSRRIYHYHDAIGENDNEGTVRRLEKNHSVFCFFERVSRCRDPAHAGMAGSKGTVHP